MGMHLTEKYYSEGSIHQGDFIFFRGALRKVASVSEGAIRFEDLEGTWEPVKNERFEVPEDQEPQQGIPG